MTFGPWVRPVALYQSGSAIGLAHAPVAVLGEVPPPLADETSQVWTPVVSAQIACSWTVVPGVPPRDTNVAWPAAPAAATFPNAWRMSYDESPESTPAGSFAG